MGFALTSKDYAAYLRLAYDKIHADGDYITALDAATGDGDHWANLDMGFEKLAEAAPRLEEMPLADCFKEIGRIMMTVIGGSSGVLYGSAYLAAAKTLQGKDRITGEDLCAVLAAMMEAIMSRGKAEPGHKTMLDTLHPAVACYRDCLRKGLPEAETLALVRAAVIEGAESTLGMEASRGRAYYQKNKGVGHLDPGAVTMSYQLQTLIDYIAATL